MPEMNGLEAARVISQMTPETPILMVTMHMSPQLAVEARKVGIRGTCSKANIHCVVQAVETLLNHGTYFAN
jgi:DNA-binding NarL/FixJ family response regulator